MISTEKITSKAILPFVNNFFICSFYIKHNELQVAVRKFCAATCSSSLVALVAIYYFLPLFLASILSVA